MDLSGVFGGLVLGLVGLILMVGVMVPVLSNVSGVANVSGVSLVSTKVVSDFLPSFVMIGVLIIVGGTVAGMFRSSDSEDYSSEEEDSDEEDEEEDDDEGEDEIKRENVEGRVVEVHDEIIDSLDNITPKNEDWVKIEPVKEEVKESIKDEVKVEEPKAELGFFTGFKK
jgi:hypothetical protein